MNIPQEKRICPNGHPLFYVYWRDANIAMGRIPPFLYCVECQEFSKINSVGDVL